MPAATATSDTATTLPMTSITVKVNGTDKPLNSLTLLEVETSLRLPALAAIAFNDAGHEQAETFSLGAKVEITAQPEGKDKATLFKGEVIAVEARGASGAVSTVIRCADGMRKLYGGRTSKVFPNMKVSDIASQIIGGAGLQSQVTATSEKFALIVQHNENDGEFLERLAAESGSMMYMTTEEKLYFGPPPKLRESTAIPTAGRAGTYQAMFGEDLVAYEVITGPKPPVDTIAVRGWDQLQKQAFTHEAKVKDSARAAFAAIGADDALTPESGRTLAVSPVHVTSASHAQTLAESIADHVSASKVRFRGLLAGNPYVAAGVELAVGGASATFNGHYIVTSARQTFEKGELRTEVVCDGLGDRALLSGVNAAQPVATDPVNPFPWVTTGIVTNVNDDEKDGKNRVKVKLPGLVGDQFETGWLRVVTPAAGKDHGFSWLPEVNDEVVVVFDRGDMRHGYVLGGVYNAKDTIRTTAAPAQANGKVEKRAITTPVGHQLLFTDKSGSEAIELHTGDTKIVMKFDQANQLASIDVSSGTAKMTMDGQGKKVTVECPSGDIELKATNIKLDATSNVTINAQSNFEAKGTAGAKLESSAQVSVKGAMAELNGSGQTTVKGGMVMIN